MDERHDDPPTQPADVVSLEDARRARGARTRPKVAAAGLPEQTGVAAINDSLLANLRESQLTDDTINAARLFALPSAKWRPYGFRSSARPQPGLLIPFFGPGATEPFAFRLRPQFPIPSGKKKGKFKKYDQPYGTGPLVYMPPLAATVEHLGAVDRPLYWTEGEKKALLLAQLGHCVVGLTGVDNWGDSEARARGEGRRLHAFISEHYRIAGRQHVIVFDADARAKQEVTQAMQRLAGLLTHLGGASVHMCLPPDAGAAKGIDDYAHAHGLDATRNLLATVREPVEEIAPDLGCVPLAHFGSTFIGSGAERLRMPRGYDVERDGSLWVTDEVDPDAKKLALDAPIVIARQLTDVYSSTLRSDVRFRDSRGAWRSVIVPRERLGDARMLVAALRPHGCLVTTGNAAAAMRYLDAFERDNGSLIEQARCAASTGWHEGQFVLPETLAPEGVERIQLDGSPEQLRMFSSLRPAYEADVELHVLALRPPMDASRECSLAVFAALAAPLLHMLRQGNFAVHLSGDSSRGKTSMLRIAASVFGDPRSTGWVASWNTTLSGLEHRASLLNDLPQIYDEVGVVGVEAAEQYVYTLCNGEGRQRSTKELNLRETLRWRTVVLSTGERELADEASANTGAQARVINLSVNNFGGLGAAAIDEAVTACALQHGAVGRAWLQWLVSLDEDDARMLREQHAEYAAELRGIAEATGDRIGQRVAGYFATMALAENHVFALFGLGADDGRTVVELFRDRGAEPDARVKPLAERVLDVLREWVAAEPSAFPDKQIAGLEPEKQHRVHGYTGHRGPVGQPLVCFHQRALVEHLRKSGLPWTRALKRELREAGALVTEAGVYAAKGNVTTRIQIGGRQQVVLAVALEVESSQHPQEVSPETHTLKDE